jgi:hypothetical protein
VAGIPRCAEGGAAWLPDDPGRWRLRLDIDDYPVWFCPSCEREFGDHDGIACETA